MAFSPAAGRVLLTGQVSRYGQAPSTLGWRAALCERTDWIRRIETMLVENLESEGGVRAVERAIDILECFVGSAGGLKVLEIEKKTGIARPTLYRLLRTLEARRLVRKCSDPTRYDLDYGIVSLAHTWLRGVNFLSKIEPMLDELAIQAGETVALCMAKDDKRVYVREIASNNPLTLIRGVGAIEPLTVGAAGMAILAEYDDDRIAEIIANLKQDERERILAEVRDTRQKGYAISVGRVIEGASAIAVPFHDQKHRVQGSISVSGPSARLTASRYEQIAALAAACASQVGVVV